MTKMLLTNLGGCVTLCNFVLRRRRVECQVTPEYLTDAHGSTICVVKSHQSYYRTLHLNDNLQKGFTMKEFK